MQDIQKQQITRKKETGFRLHPERINRKGRPSIPEKRHLENALREVAKENGNKHFLHHIAELAYTDKSVALAVLDKIVPDIQYPKDQDESNGIKQIIIVRPEQRKETVEVVSRPICVQPENVPRAVEQLGDRKNDGLNIAGNVIQRASS